jgi:hypothetical protein
MKKIELKEESEKSNVEEARRKFINGGGLVVADVEEQIPLEVNETPKLDEWIKLNLRIRKDAVDLIDKLIKNLMGFTRTGWILEAIQEKFKKEKGNE